MSEEDVNPLMKICHSALTLTTRGRFLATSGHSIEARINYGIFFSFSHNGRLPFLRPCIEYDRKLMEGGGGWQIEHYM